jgi:hypothetical protein
LINISFCFDLEFGSFLYQKLSDFIADWSSTGFRAFIQPFADRSFRWTSSSDVPHIHVWMCRYLSVIVPCVRLPLAFTVPSLVYDLWAFILAIIAR